MFGSLGEKRKEEKRREEKKRSDHDFSHLVWKFRREEKVVFLILFANSEEKNRKERGITILSMFSLGHRIK